MDATRAVTLLAATVITNAHHSWLCAIMSHPAWLAATFAAVGHLITDAGLVLMVVLPVAANLAVRMWTVLLRILWRSTSRVNLRLLRRNKGDGMITTAKKIFFSDCTLNIELFGVHHLYVSCFVLSCLACIPFIIRSLEPVYAISQFCRRRMDLKYSRLKYTKGIWIWITTILVARSSSSCVV